MLYVWWVCGCRLTNSHITRWQHCIDIVTSMQVLILSDNVTIVFIFEWRSVEWQSRTSLKEASNAQILPSVSRPGQTGDKPNVRSWRLV
jgi:hypothetical protein